MAEGVGVLFSQPGCGDGCGGCAGCDHAGFCLHARRCDVDIAGAPVVVTTAAGATLASASMPGDGSGVCVTWPTGSPPAPNHQIRVQVDHRGCRLIVARNSIIGGVVVPGGDPCVQNPAIGVCFADVTVRAVDLTTGADVAERAFAQVVGPGGGDVFASCGPQPTRFRRVSGIFAGFPGSPSPFLAGSTCTADYSIGNAIPANARVRIGSSRQACVGGSFGVTDYKWECERIEDWCCTDATFTVGGLPLDGDELWTGRLGTCLAIAQAAGCCLPAAEMTFANQGFYARKVAFSSSFFYYYPARDPDPGDPDPDAPYERHDDSLDAELTLQCVPNGFGGTTLAWRSAPISVNWPIGFACCATPPNPPFGGGVCAADPEPVHATSVRVTAYPGVLGVRPPRVTIEGLGDDRPTCTPPLVFKGSACVVGGANWSSAPAVLPEGTPVVETRDVSLFVGEQATPPTCDNHVDWLFTRDLGGYGYDSTRPRRIACTLFGSMHLIGPV